MTAGTEDLKISFACVFVDELTQYNVQQISAAVSQCLFNFGIHAMVTCYKHGDDSSLYLLKSWEHTEKALRKKQLKEDIEKSRYEASNEISQS